MTLLAILFQTNILWANNGLLSKEYNPSLGNWKEGYNDLLNEENLFKFELERGSDYLVIWLKTRWLQPEARMKDAFDR